MTTPTRSLFSPSVKSSAPASTHPEPVLALAKHLKRTKVEQLRDLSKETLRLAMDELELPAESRADIDLWLGAPAPHSINTDTSALATAVERQRMAKLFPWLIQEEACLRQIQRFSDDWAVGEDAALKALREEFESKAKAGSLGPLESLVGQYCLYVDDTRYSTYLLMALLLRVPASSRIQVHNWMVAGDMPRATKETFGDAIAALQVPLFPVCAGLQVANMKLMEAALPHQAQAQAMGAGWLPVSQHEGAWGVDTSPLENAFSNELAIIRNANAVAQRNAQRAARRAARAEQVQPQIHQPPPAYHARRYGPRGAGTGDDAILDALFSPNPQASQQSQQSPQPVNPQPTAPQPSAAKKRPPPPPSSGAPTPPAAPGVGPRASAPEQGF